MTVTKNHPLVGSIVIINDPVITERIGIPVPSKAKVVGLRNNFGKKDFKLIAKGRVIYLKDNYFNILN